MAKYIPLDALLAEIEKRYEYWREKESNSHSIESEIRMSECRHLMLLLNTLEVKEVDFDFAKEVDVWIEDNGDTNGFFNVQELAKHFFELGMRVNNPITAADRGTAEEIIINLKRVEQDYHISLAKEIEWLRNKIQKRGE